MNAQDYFKDKTVYVTAANGPLCMELCRRLLPCAPKALALFDKGPLERRLGRINALALNLRAADPSSKAADVAVSAFRADFSLFEDISQTLHRAKEEGFAPDVVFCLSDEAEFESLDDCRRDNADFRRSVFESLVATSNFLEALGPFLRPGAKVVVQGGSGDVASSPSISAFAANKFGAYGLANALRYEWKDKRVDVQCFAPPLLSYPPSAVEEQRLDELEQSASEADDEFVEVREGASAGMTGNEAKTLLGEMDAGRAVDFLLERVSKDDFLIAPKSDGKLLQISKNLFPDTWSRSKDLMRSAKGGVWARFAALIGAAAPESGDKPLRRNALEEKRDKFDARYETSYESGWAGLGDEASARVEAPVGHEKRAMEEAARREAKEHARKSGKSVDAEAGRAAGKTLWGAVETSDGAERSFASSFSHPSPSSASTPSSSSSSAVSASSRAASVERAKNGESGRAKVDSSSGWGFFLGLWGRGRRRAENEPLPRLAGKEKPENRGKTRFLEENPEFGGALTTRSANRAEAGGARRSGGGEAPGDLKPDGQFKDHSTKEDHSTIVGGDGAQGARAESRDREIPAGSKARAAQDGAGLASTPVMVGDEEGKVGAGRTGRSEPDESGEASGGARAAESVGAETANDPRSERRDRLSRQAASNPDDPEMGSGPAFDGTTPLLAEDARKRDASAFGRSAIENGAQRGEGERDGRLGSRRGLENDDGVDLGSGRAADPRADHEEGLESDAERAPLGSRGESPRKKKGPGAEKKAKLIERGDIEILGIATDGEFDPSAATGPGAAFLRSVAQEKDPGAFWDNGEDALDVAVVSDADVSSAPSGETRRPAGFDSYAGSGEGEWVDAPPVEGAGRPEPEVEGAAGLGSCHGGESGEPQDAACAEKSLGEASAQETNAERPATGGAQKRAADDSFPGSGPTSGKKTADSQHGAAEVAAQIAARGAEEGSAEEATEDLLAFSPSKAGSNGSAKADLSERAGDATTGGALDRRAATLAQWGGKKKDAALRAAQARLKARQAGLREEIEAEGKADSGDRAGANEAGEKGAGAKTSRLAPHPGDAARASLGASLAPSQAEGAERAQGEASHPKRGAQDEPLGARMVESAAPRPVSAESRRSAAFEASAAEGARSNEDHQSSRRSEAFEASATPDADGGRAGQSDAGQANAGGPGCLGVSEDSGVSGDAQAKRQENERRDAQEKSARKAQKDKRTHEEKTSADASSKAADRPPPSAANASGAAETAPIREAREKPVAVLGLSGASGAGDAAAGQEGLNGRDWAARRAEDRSGEPDEPARAQFALDAGAANGAAHSGSQGRAQARAASASKESAGSGAPSRLGTDFSVGQDDRAGSDARPPAFVAPESATFPDFGGSGALGGADGADAAPDPMPDVSADSETVSPAAVAVAAPSSAQAAMGRGSGMSDDPLAAFVPGSGDVVKGKRASLRIGGDGVKVFFDPGNGKEILPAWTPTAPLGGGVALGPDAPTPSGSIDLGLAGEKQSANGARVLGRERSFAEALLERERRGQGKAAPEDTQNSVPALIPQVGLSVLNRGWGLDGGDGLFERLPARPMRLDADDVSVPTWEGIPFADDQGVTVYGLGRFSSPYGSAQTVRPPQADGRSDGDDSPKGRMGQSDDD